MGVGASAGGLEALRELLEALPPTTGMAFILILHLSPEHKSQLAEILSKNTPMPVIEATNDLHMKQNHVYIIPPNKGISITDGTITLGNLERKSGPPLPIDGLLQSLAQHRKNNAIGVLLSGTGSDGTKGLIEIKEKGGYTFVQKPETARFPEMPRSAISEGAVDYVLTIGEIAAKLSEVGKKIVAAKQQNVEETSDLDVDSLARIMQELKARTGIDFSHYKKPTIIRRIQRRMILKNVDNFREYAELIQREPTEADALYDDILINVTSFFRDPNTFEALKTTVWPKILKNRPVNEPLRIWVPGCSSGEEVYSIAISLLEHLGNKSREFTIFGTDIDEHAINKARRGSYPEEIREQVSPDRLSRFFQKIPKGYQIKKDIRDRCIFARHNVLTDAPFLNINLISCRNLMIYLDNHLQDRIIPTFHYSLVKEGFLLLGNSETLGKYDDLFNTVDRTNRIYSKRPADVGSIYSTLVFQPTEFKSQTAEPAVSRSDYPGLLKSIHGEVDRIVQSNYAPSGVVVNEEMDIIEFRGNTDDYLGHASGTATLNLVKMAKGSLGFELRLALDKAKQLKRNVRVQGVSIGDDGKQVDFEVVPFTVPDHGSIFNLIIFKPRMESATREASQPIVEEPAKSMELERLRRELVETRVHMQSYMEEQETVKEELRSANEELRTVNDELADKNREVSTLYGDLNNFVNSTKIPIVMVDNSLKIRRITPRVEEVINVLPSDLGRPITDLKLNIDIPNLEKLIMDSLNDLRARRVDVKNSAGVWYSLRIDPYRTIDNRIDGAVLAFIDVNQLLLQTNELKEQSIELTRRIDEGSDKLVKVSERLHEAESAEAIGRLTAMLAHDLKNPIIQISQASDLAIDNPDMVGRMLRLINENAQRSLEIIDELRASTREINLNRVDTDLALLIKRFIDETTFPKRIKVETRVEEGMHINIDPSLIRRVIENLVRNAIDAMPKGGVLTIRTYEKSGSINVEVEDTGVGISEEAIPKIFDPLYTTKADGLGFGLAFSKRVVEAHGGTISFRTVIGSGTTFTVMIPHSKES